jgi:amino acid transporter
MQNNYGNAVIFAKYVLLAANPDTTKTVDLDDRLVRFIAIILVAFICLLHYFSGRFGLFINRLLALFKVILLITVFAAGMRASNQPGSGKHDLHKSYEKKSYLDGLAAMVLILYSYSGYENANYVS